MSLDNLLALCQSSAFGHRQPRASDWLDHHLALLAESVRDPRIDPVAPRWFRELLEDGSRPAGVNALPPDC